MSKAKLGFAGCYGVSFGLLLSWANPPDWVVVIAIAVFILAGFIAFS